MKKNHLKANLFKLPFKVLYAFIGLFFGAIKSLKPIFTTGFRLIIGLLSFVFGAIISLISKQSRNDENQKLRQMEKFFMSSYQSKNKDNRNYAARERFDSELRNLKEIERDKKRRFSRIDGAGKIASVGSGLLTGGFLLDVNFFAGVPAAFALRDPAAGPKPLLPLAALACGVLWSFLNRELGRLTPGISSHGLFLWSVVMMFRMWGPSV